MLLMCLLFGNEYTLNSCHEHFVEAHKFHGEVKDDWNWHDAVIHCNNRIVK